MDDLAAVTAPRFVPLRIESVPAGGTAAAVFDGVSPAPVQERSFGSIEIEIGSARLWVEGVVDPEVLRQMLGLIRPAR